MFRSVLPTLGNFNKFNRFNRFNRLNCKLNCIFYRNISTFTINKYTESIVEKEDYPLDRCRNILDNKTIGVLGYGPQGQSQALNLRDNGFDVIVGTRKKNQDSKALNDCWVEDKTLFSIEETVERSDILMYLLSDVGQMLQWPNILLRLRENQTLYFSHGFGVVYNDKTKIVPPDNLDVVLVAPKGAGISVREKFTKGEGINVSYAIHQDYSGRAEDTTLALAFGIGCGHAFKTTFENEVYSDLVGERSVLMGMIQGAFSAQYKVLRERGHSLSEAYNETVEEALVSLYPLITENGMDWLYANCSTTAQRGALDWAPKFENAIKPIIEECYDSVKNGSETQNVIDANSDSDYRKKLNLELKELSNTELWKVAKILRKLRN